MRQQRAVSKAAPAAALGWLGAALALGTAMGQLGLYGAGCDVPDAPALPRLPYGLIFSLPFLLTAVLGALILTYRPHNRIGAIALIGGAANALAVFLPTYAACEAPGPLPGQALAAGLFGPVVGVGFLTLLVLLPLLFPDGQFVSPGWRRLAQAAIGMQTVIVAVSAVWPGPLGSLGIALPFDNPLALPLTPTPALDKVVRMALPVSVSVFALLANASLIQRWRQASGEVRQQLKWLAYYLATGGSVLLSVEPAGFLVYPGLFESPLYYAEVAVVWLGLPTVLGLAVFKYRLYAIDIVIRRTLIYTSLSAALAGVYLGSVVLLQGVLLRLTGERRSQLVTVVSTLAIAALAGPLRRRMQNFIDRRFYRRKYDAAKVITAFGATLRDETNLERLGERLVAVVDETMQPAQAALWVRRRG